MSKAKRIPFIREALRTYRIRLALLCLLTVVQAVLQVSMALLMRVVIDTAVAGDDPWGTWAILLGANLLCQVGAYGLIRWYMSSTVDSLAATLRIRLLKSAVYSQDSRLQAYHSGSLLNRAMDDVYTVCDGYVYALPALVGQVTRLGVAFAAVVLISYKVALVLLAAAAVMVAAISLLRPMLKKRHRSMRKAQEKVMTTIQEDLQQLELIQSLQAQEQTLHRFRFRIREELKAETRRRIWSVGSQSIISLITILGTGVLLMWGAMQVAAGTLSYGSLTAMLQLLTQFQGPVTSLSGLWTRFAAVEVAQERLVLLMEVPTPAEDCIVDTPRAVVFENVTFRYPGDELAVVENFTLRIPLEGWVSLSGISGRGKTTLFKLILGLYTPQQGQVYLETDQGKLPCSPATRHLFAYVPQDYALFSGTVRENLLLVAPDADEQCLRDALKTAAADFIWEQPQGEDTRLGENNTGLSKGQLQRIAIARALLMGRKILLLDECTSALDARTEETVLKNLRSLCPNALLVTHRPQPLEDLGVSRLEMGE